MAGIKTTKIASFFSGCGGMDLGLLGGFNYLGKRYKKFPTKIVFAIDSDKRACDLYNINFDHKCLTGDIRKIPKKNLPGHDILVGGFPCQSFSIVAQNPPRLGYKDENGKLFFEMRDVLKVKKPQTFIAENVKGILSANDKRAFPLIVEAFEKEGYHVTFALLNSSNYGIPQKRERVFIVGFRDKEKFKKFKFPDPVTVGRETIPLKEVILDSRRIPKRYYFSKKALDGLRRANKSMNKGRAQKFDQPCNTINSHLAKVSLNSTDPVLKIKGRYRRFTPLEAARIQSFPDSFKFEGPDSKQYWAIGNAVPPVLMWHVAKSVYKALNIA